MASGTINAWLLTTTGELVAVDLADPSRNITFSRPSGLVAASGSTPAEQLIDIDYRNADGALYGLTDQSRLYLLNPTSGATTLISHLRTADDSADYNLDSNASYSMDFDPASDRLRLIGSNGDNLSVEVASGRVTVGTAVNGSGALISGVAFSDSFDSSGRKSQLYGIDADQDMVFQQDTGTGAQSGGVSLGVDASTVRGYDIDPATGAGYAILTVANKTRVYSIDPGAAGAVATPVGPRDTLPGDVVYRGMTVVTTANPTVLGLGADNTLYQFTAQQPGLISNPVSISLPGSETLLGMDLRPSDGLLYGLGSGGHIYRISLDSTTLGTATLVSTLAADSSDSSSPFSGLSSGVSYCADFDPVAPGGTVSFPDQNRLRLLGSDLSNAVIIADDGSVTTGTSLTPSTTTLAASAYSNNYRNSVLSSLFVIHDDKLSVVSQQSSTEGALTTVGSLGFTVSGSAGFDIAGYSNDNILLAARSTGSGPFTLYKLETSGSGNLATAVDQIGGASGPTNLIDITIRD